MFVVPKHREVALSQIPEESFAGFDGFTRDLALGDADGLGHLGDDLLVASGRNAGDEDLEHSIGQTAMFADGIVGRDFDLSGLGILLPKP